MIRILLADDHKIIRDGLKALLEQTPEFKITGEAEDGQKAVTFCRKAPPDVVIMDISMPLLNGIEATRQVLAENPGIRIIGLSMHNDKQFIQRMLEAGATGFLLKDCDSDELQQAIRAVMQGELYLSRSVASAILKDYVSRSSRPVITEGPRLSPREKEVLQLLSEGKSTKETAAILSVSVKTIETHRMQIMEKLDIHSIAELTKYAIREGLTSLT